MSMAPAVRHETSGILLQSDTNELEIVEFQVDEIDWNGETTSCYYGVNVAKVREIIHLPKVTKSPSANQVIEGMISLRGKIIPLLNLAKVLNKNTGDLKAERVLVLEFNDLIVGVMVHSVSRIYRVSWTDVEPPVSLSGSDLVTGLVKMSDHIILVLDFEKIVGELCVSSALQPLTEAQLVGREDIERQGKKLLVADDSLFIRNMMVSSLRAAGYEVVEAEDGLEAWEKLQEFAKAGAKLEDTINLVITDIEMPRMDGLHLTAQIRQHEVLKGLPVILFSSLASEDNKRKWEKLGANDILTKPELPLLVQRVDELIQRSC